MNFTFHRDLWDLNGSVPKSTYMNLNFLVVEMHVTLWPVKMSSSLWSESLWSAIYIIL